MNSKRNALLALMIATNFVELKGNVYKRTDTNKLWMLACMVGYPMGVSPPVGCLGVLLCLYNVCMTLCACVFMTPICVRHTLSQLSCLRYHEPLQHADVPQQLGVMNELPGAAAAPVHFVTNLMITSSLSCCFTCLTAVMAGHHAELIISAILLLFSCHAPYFGPPAGHRGALPPDACAVLCGGGGHQQQRHLAALLGHPAGVWTHLSVGGAGAYLWPPLSAASRFLHSPILPGHPCQVIFARSSPACSAPVGSVLLSWAGWLQGVVEAKEDSMYVAVTV
jgi:hypothetical protein